MEQQVSDSPKTFETHLQTLQQSKFLAAVGYSSEFPYAWFYAYQCGTNALWVFFVQNKRRQGGKSIPGPDAQKGSLDREHTNVNNITPNNFFIFITDDHEKAKNKTYQPNEIVITSDTHRTYHVF